MSCPGDGGRWCPRWKGSVCFWEGVGFSDMGNGVNHGSLSRSFGGY